MNKILMAIVIVMMMAGVAMAGSLKPAGNNTYKTQDGKWVWPVGNSGTYKVQGGGYLSPAGGKTVHGNINGKTGYYQLPGKLYQGAGSDGATNSDKEEYYPTVGSDDSVNPETGEYYNND